MNWRLPLSDVKVSEEDVEAVLECYRGGWLSMGPRIHKFEQAFAEAVGAPTAIAVSSGTAALHLSLLAAGVGPGDEVILPALTFVAAAHAVRACGGTPVLCDSIGPQDFNMDPADVATHITPATKVILATHWNGYVCDVDALQRLADEHGLLLIEDAAQAILARAPDGRSAGMLSSAGCFSLFSKKQLCVGEGGMVTTADEALAAKVRSLRSPSRPRRELRHRRRRLQLPNGRATSSPRPLAPAPPRRGHRKPPRTGSRLPRRTRRPRRRHGALGRRRCRALLALRFRGAVRRSRRP